MEKRIFLLIIFIMAQAYQMEAGDNMKYDKVIYREAKGEKVKQKFTPESISGLWRISSDKKIMTFGIEKTPYCLVIDKNETSGKAIFFDPMNGKIIDKITVSIKRTGIGVYEIKYKNTKRIFVVSFFESDGTMYLYYEDSNKYSEDPNSVNGYSAALKTREMSDEVINKFISDTVEYYKIGE